MGWVRPAMLPQEAQAWLLPQRWSLVTSSLPSGRSDSEGGKWEVAEKEPNP